MAINQQYMLTTTDNPWNPWTHWDEWYAWDHAAGYDTAGLLARITNFSFDLPDGDQDLVVQEAIDEIVSQDPSGIYRKISEHDMQRVA